MAWRVQVVFTVWEALMIAFVVTTIAVTAYLLVRFVVRMRSGDEMETAHHWSDHITGGRKDQTPEEAVEEWEQKSRKHSRFRRPQGDE